MEDNSFISDKLPYPVNMTQNLHVLEQRVPIEVQMEYFNYSNQIRKKNIVRTEEDYTSYMRCLNDENLSIKRKKHILSTLAIAHDIKAYRLIEEYINTPHEPEIENWSHLALMESRITIESELLDERQIYISTGLGGRGNKLRFFVLMLVKGNGPFLEYQRQIIEREFAYNLPEKECELERLTIYDEYAEVVMLVPMTRDIKDILEVVLSECNQYGEFIAESITVTNVRELSEDDIKDIIAQKKSGYHGKLFDAGI